MGWGSPLVIGLGLVSLASLTAFILYERRSANPIIPFHLISNRNIAIANFGIFMVGFTFQLMAQANTFIFEVPRPNGYGLSILETGFWMLPNAVVQLIAAPILGRQLMRIDTKRLSIAGALVAGGGMILISYLAFIDLPHIVSSTIVIGLGSTMLNISLVNIVIFSVERSSLGTAAGLNTVFRNLGSAWGPAVAGTIMNQFKDTLLLSTSPLYRFKYHLTLHIN